MRIRLVERANGDREPVTSGEAEMLDYIKWFGEQSKDGVQQVRDEMEWRGRDALEGWHAARKGGAYPMYAIYTRDGEEWSLEHHLSGIFSSLPIIDDAPAVGIDVTPPPRLETRQRVVEADEMPQAPPEPS